ncbi:MAG: hypothetical protein ABR567_13335 [Myxococcales bacterium]|nr:hypothetical protein [Myxococcales bacterium]
MRGYLKRIVTEPGVDTARAYARRVRLLAVTYVVLFVSSCGGAVLLALEGKLFVTLAQRSNVETLTILFLLVFYSYLAMLSAPGALGAVRIAARGIRGTQGLDGLGPPGDGPYAALGVVLERSDGAPLTFELEGLGRLAIDGARIAHRDALRGGSADLIGYFVRQLEEITGRDVPIVVWGQLDDDDAERYLAQVSFARALQKHLGAGPLWPTLALNAAQCDELSLRLLEIGPALAEECLLPDWEYSAEHKLPVIPEPLGLVSLGRSAKRADPMATMGFATAMVLLTLGVIVLFVLRTPWVPG